MWWYILKRLLLMVPTLFGVLLLTFVVVQFVPGGPVEQMGAVQPMDSVPEPQPLASCMPMPNTNAPTINDGPIGAIAPPKLCGMSAVTGTMARAATAISKSPPSKPSGWPLTMKRRHDAVKLNSVFRNATPSAKPSASSARRCRIRCFSRTPSAAAR